MHVECVLNVWVCGECVGERSERGCMLNVLQVLVECVSVWYTLTHITHTTITIHRVCVQVLWQVRTQQGALQSTCHWHR